MNKFNFKDTKNMLNKTVILLYVLYFVFPWEFGFLLLKPGVAEAASVNITSRIDFDAGIKNGTETVSKEGEIKLQPSGTWGARAWKTPNLALGDSSPITSDGSYVYLIPYRDNELSRYIPSENRWQILSPAPFDAYIGSDMTYFDGNIYVIFGGYQKKFARYSIAQNTWTILADLKDLVQTGASITNDGRYVYVLRGTATTDFWRYDPLTDSWSTKNSPPASIYTGSDMVYSNGFIYAPRGYNSKTFYAYEVEEDTWTSLGDAPNNFYDNRNITIRDGYIYVLRGYNTTDFYRYKINGGGWETLTSAPIAPRYVGASYNASDDTIYVFRGNGQYDFWKYDATNNVFLGETDLPNTANTGADIINHENYIYFRRGSSSTNFYRYNKNTGVWDTLANSLASSADDTKGASAGAMLYYPRGSNTREFYSYDTAGGQWTRLSDPNYNFGAGASVAYPGTGDYLYVTRGGSTSTFYRYSISGNSWDDAGATDLPDNAEAGVGSRLTSDGIDIYAISGIGTASILKYTIGGSWTVLNSVPFAPYYGTDIVYHSGKIYAQSGYYKPDFWEYTIATNTWRRLPDMQSNSAGDLGPYTGGSLASNGGGMLYSIPGLGTNRILTYLIDDKNYQASGTWTSNVYDLTYVSSWTSIASSSAEPGGTYINLETRTSTDSAHWDEGWISVDADKIISEKNRYIQVKATLNSSLDQAQTPVLSSLVINYKGDESSPTNPSNVTGASQVINGVSLISGNTYRYPSPYFSWSDGLDQESAVAGYYIYFGNSSSAIPSEVGNLQTETNYLVTQPLTTGSYYFRIQTKDTAGNISDPETKFVYNYSGVTLNNSLTASSSADFLTGQMVNISSESGKIQLASRSAYWLEERLSLSTSTLGEGSSMAYVSATNKLYVLRGSNTTTFYEYDIATDAWTQKANTPSAVNRGGQIIEGSSGFLYAFRGENSSAFWRYDIENNTWSDELALDAPQTVYYGASMIYDGSRYIYALKGSNDDTFMRYDTETDTWEIMTNTDFGAPIEQYANTVYVGGDLTYDGNDTIYAIQGYLYSGFASYSIQSNSWSQLAKLPSLPYYGSSISFDQTSNAIYYLPGYGRSYFYKYSLDTQEWVRLQDAPALMSSTSSGGTEIRNVNGVLYITRGGGSQNFYKYNIAKNSWTIPNMGLFGGLYKGTDNRYFYYGADIEKGDENNFYIVRGNYDNLFIKYNSVTGEVTRLADAPAGFYLGGDLVYESTHNKIYATVNSYYRKLFVYDIATDTWSEEVDDPPPYDVGAGTSMVYDGSRYIYWTRGGGNNTFYRFDTQQITPGAKWGTALGTIPAGVSYGSEMIYKNGYIYITRGNNQLGFYRYDTNLGTWDDGAVSDLPTGGNIYRDAFLVDGGGDLLYACKGENTPTCYSYSINYNSWNLIANSPANIYYGGAAASNGVNKIFVIGGAGTNNTFTNGLYTLVMQTETSAFQEEGIYTSASYDLGSAYRFSGITVTYASATNNTLTVETRTSSDDLNWTTWAEAAEEKLIGNVYNYKISSAINRYIQVRFTLNSSDGICSGYIDDYTINYYRDSQDPINPTLIEGFSDASHSAEIISGEWKNFTNPSFTWPLAEAVGGASDTATGSGVIGYYVYFGSNPNATPSASESYYQTGNSYTASSLVSGTTYYLRIQTKDDAENISDEIWQPFIYKFDNTAPTNPSTVTVDPSYYTSLNNYTFSWSGAEDSGSGIKDYCYKLGTDGSEECGVTVASMSGSFAYQTGNNILYLRVRDNADNGATSYIPTTYYYSSTAPGAPTNLTVEPESNTVNEFSFSWDPPTFYYGAQASLRYYYSINALPTSRNVNQTGLSTTYLATDAYATLPGENILYVVAKDEAGNIDYNNYAQVSFTADTSAPGAPTKADIADISVKSLESWKLALSWEAPTSTGSGVSAYKVYHSTTGDADCTNNFDDFTYLASTTGKSYVDTDLTQEIHYYCVKACDSTNNCSAVSDTVSLYPDGKWDSAPDMTASPSATVKTKSANITWSTSRTCSSFVKYGKSADSYDQEVGSSTQVTSHDIDLIGLDPGTTYHYKVLYTDEDGNTGESSDQDFTTNPAPFISSVKVTSVSLYSAYITFTVKNASQINMKYGKTLSYGGIKTMSTSITESTYTVLLDSLTEGTLYHLQLEAEDEEGNVFTGDDYTFKTLPVPKISNLSIQQVVGMPTATLRITWTSNTSITSIITYYPSTNPELARDQISLTPKTKHEMILTDLKDSMEYTVIIKGKDKANNEAKSTPQKVKTAIDFRPPEIINMSVESTIIGVGDEAKAQIVVSWDTDEPATSQVQYAEGTGTTYGQSTQEDTSLTTNHIVTITGLSPAKIYHLQALSKDKAGNLGQSYDSVTVTPKATKAALDLVINNLTNTFGFLGGLPFFK